MLEKLSIRTQILVTFATLATISLIVVSGISLGNVNNIGTITEDQASEALTDQIRRNILQSSDENAGVIEKKFANAEAAVRKLVRTTEALFNREIVFDPIPSFLDDDLGSLPNATLDPTYAEVISNTTSTYYHYEDYVETSLNSQQNSNIEITAHLDSVFASIYELTDEYVWLYLAMDPDLGGTFRNFPGANVPNDYDPQSDFFYSDADAQLGELVYVSPYFDPTQGLVITLSQAAYFTNGTLIGVIGLDFKSSVVRDKVLDVSFLNSGYASLIQAGDQIVVAHPEFEPEGEADAETILQEIETNAGGSSALSDSDIVYITSGQQDVITYTRDGEVYYLAFAPIKSTDGVTQYTFLISVLASEVIEPVNAIRVRIQSSVDSISSSVILLSVLTILGALIVGLWIAGNITKPVARLTRIARQITMNATKEDIFDGVNFGSDLESDDEIGELSRSFQSMVGKLREEQRQKGKKQ